MLVHRVKELKRGWWLSMIGGALSIVLGLCMVLWPGIGLVTLVYVFASFMLIMGLVNAVQAAVEIENNGMWWLAVLFGILSAGAGVYLLANPAASMSVLMVFLAVYVIVQALMDLVVAIGTERDNWIWVLTGVLGMIFGVLILAYPAEAVMTLVISLGVYALVQGVATEVYVFMSRREARRLERAYGRR